MKGLMNMKRVLAMLLCLSMVLGLVPALALAEEAAPVQSTVTAQELMQHGESVSGEVTCVISQRVRRVYTEEE